MFVVLGVLGSNRIIQLLYFVNLNGGPIILEL